MQTRRFASEALALALEQAGLEVVHAKNAAHALALARGGHAELVVAELGDGQTALALLLHFRTRGESAVPVVLLASGEPAALRVRALQMGAEDVVDEDLPLGEQVARVERALRSKARLDRLATESAALRQLAVTDGLTQLSNYRHFQERLAEELRRAQRYGDSLALILLDLDHFKQLNDRFGHPAGDAVLRRVATVLQSHVRDTDLLARQGGEEFAVILPKTTLEGAVQVAERIRLSLHDELRAGELHAPITASFGVAVHPFPAFETPEALFAAADRALYRAKRHGRDRVEASYDDAGASTSQAAS